MRVNLRGNHDISGQISVRSLNPFNLKLLFLERDLIARFLPTATWGSGEIGTNLVFRAIAEACYTREQCDMHYQTPLTREKDERDRVEERVIKSTFVLVLFDNCWRRLIRGISSFYLNISPSL